MTTFELFKEDKKDKVIAFKCKGDYFVFTQSFGQVSTHIGGALIDHYTKSLKCNVSFSRGYRDSIFNSLHFYTLHLFNCKVTKNTLTGFAYVCSKRFTLRIALDEMTEFQSEYVKP